MRISDWSSDVCSSDLLDAANAELGKLLFDLAAQVAVHGGARFDSEEGPEITHRNAVERAKPVPAFVQISVRPARRCLDQRIWPGLEVEIGVERWRNQRVGEADKLDDAVQIGRASCRERVCQYV